MPYAVYTLLDVYGRATRAVVQPLPYWPTDPVRIMQRPEGVVKIDYYQRYSEVVRAMRNMEPRKHGFIDMLKRLVV